MRTLLHKQLIERSEGNEFVFFMCDTDGPRRGRKVEFTHDGIFVTGHIDNRLQGETVRTFLRILEEMSVADLKAMHGTTVEEFPTMVKGWQLLPLASVMEIEACYDRKLNK